MQRSDSDQGTSNLLLTDGNKESLRGVMANVLDWDISVSEFELLSRYYRLTSLGKV